MSDTATTPSLSELIEAKAALEAKIAAIQSEGKREAVKKARDFVAKHGLTAADVFPAGKGKRTIARAPVKYRDSKTGDTWSGRGLKPTWLRSRIAEGHKIEDFLVDSAL